MTFTINNGRRTDVTFGPYSGRAGVSEAGDEAAFFAKLRDFKDARSGVLKVTEGTIDGAEHRVLDAQSSHLVDGMVILSVAAVTTQPTG